VSHLDVLMQYFETVYSHLTNKKKEPKRFLEYINANNSVIFRIRINVALFIELNVNEFIKYLLFVSSFCFKISQMGFTISILLFLLKNIQISN
jgi:hypothetical protein